MIDAIAQVYLLLTQGVCFIERAVGVQEKSDDIFVFFAELKCKSLNICQSEIHFEYTFFVEYTFSKSLMFSR